MKQMTPNGSNWLQLAPKGSNWIKLAPTGSTWLQLAPTGSNWLQLASFKLLQIAPNGSNGTKLLQFTLNCSKWLYFIDHCLHSKMYCSAFHHMGILLIKSFHAHRHQDFKVKHQTYYTQRLHQESQCIFY